MILFPEYLFPVIDILRFAVKNTDFNKEISLKYGDTIMEKLKCTITSNISNNVLVTFRALCNLFQHSYGEELIFKYRIDLLEILTSVSANSKNIQVYLNYFKLFLNNILITD